MTKIVVEHTSKTLEGGRVHLLDPADHGFLLDPYA